VSGFRFQGTEVRSQRTEDRRQKTEVRGQKADKTTSNRHLTTNLQSPILPSSISAVAEPLWGFNRGVNQKSTIQKDEYRISNDEYRMMNERQKQGQGKD